MRRLKFYDAEDAAHPIAASVSVYRDRELAEGAIRHLFPDDRVAVRWLRKGSRVSWAFVRGRHRIEFAESATWLTLAHECAHLIEFASCGSTEHRPRFAMFVASVVDWLDARGYIAKSMSRQADALTLRELATRYPWLKRVI